MRRALMIALALLGAGAAIIAGRAVAQGVASLDAGAPNATIDAAPSPIALAVAAGRHWRIDTSHGPVHVWIPAGYHADGAAVFAYAHGYYTDVDGAWRNYQLPEQFALSGVNAMFIAVEAPSGNRQPVMWRSLSELLSAVQVGTELPMPAGIVVAAGHSGAFRTLIPWLDDPRVDTVIMVDAAYGEIDPFEAWAKASPRHRLIDIGDDTVQWTDELHRALPETVAIDRFPAPELGALGELPADARDARILYIRSQMGHMRLVTEGLALPLVLRALPVEILPDAPWAQPLGVLPPLPPDGGVGAGDDDVP